MGAEVVVTRGYLFEVKYVVTSGYLPAAAAVNQRLFMRVVFGVPNCSAEVTASRSSAEIDVTASEVILEG